MKPTEFRAHVVATVLDGISGLLGALGFELKGKTLRKKVGSAVQLIELQEGEEGRLELLAGVFYGDIAKLAARLPEGAYLRSYLEPPALTACPERLQIGTWSPRLDSDLRRLTEEMTLALVELALPWFAPRRDWRSCCAQWVGLLASVAATKLDGEGDRGGATQGEAKQTPPA